MASATGILETTSETTPDQPTTDQLHQLHMNFKEEKLYEKCKIDTW